jgi:predicted nucleotidyltransferase
MKRLDEDDLGKMSTSLHGRPEIIAAYCFGSQARAQSAHQRDVDIAVLADARLPLHNLLALRRDLSLALGTDRLDLVDLRAAGPVLKRNVIAAEARFYCRNEHLANEFELRALSEYRDSAYRRRIQTDILRGEHASQ